MRNMWLPVLLTNSLPLYLSQQMAALRQPATCVFTHTYLFDGNYRHASALNGVTS
jgi:hypothetical protein